MIDSHYNDLAKFLESHKDKSKTYVVGLLGHEGNYQTLTNASLMELAFMIKSLDELYDQLLSNVRKATPPAPPSSIIQLAKKEIIHE